MKWLAYALVGVCSGAFVGWGAYASFLERPIFGALDGTSWVELLTELLAAVVGALVGAAGAVLFGWSIRSRHRF